jgi:hypothetical protein
MSVYAWLAPLAPYLAGEWRWLGYALIALPQCVALWAVFGRRWRPDGVRRCTKCSHAFDPAERFDRAEGVRCTECGHVVRTEAAALARRGRAQVFVAGVAAAVLLAVPLMAWHSVHVFLARAILPRWVIMQRADFPNGLVLVEEVDPVQQLLDWAPNPDGSAWQANFFDYDVPDRVTGGFFFPCGNYHPWPDRWRVRAWKDPAHPSDMRHMGPCQFGVEFTANDGSPLGGTMPAVGAPGFGSDITGDGEPDVILGELNTGSGGGITWIRITPPEEAAQDGGPSFSVIGMGMFRRDEAHGDWVFMSTCHGFRYMFAPGAAGVRDPEILCTWDPLRRSWAPDSSRMRREPERALLAREAAEATRAWDECERFAVDGDDGGPIDESTLDAASRARLEALRDAGASGRFNNSCPGLKVHMLAGVVELVTTGHGAEWEAWVRMAWPPRAGDSYREWFVASMRQALETCECSEVLRELGAVPSAPAAPMVHSASPPAAESPVQR